MATGKLTEEKCMMSAKKSTFGQRVLQIVCTTKKKKKE
jgi:hypothetical protein